MEHAGIAAYDLPERVAGYDRDMQIMHPNRDRMVDALLDVLAQARDTTRPFTAIDLGVGTGVLASRLLERFPQARVLAIDGAGAMLDLARVRLGDARSRRVEFRVGDFRWLAHVLSGFTADVVCSSFALHHLTRDEKRQTLADAFGALGRGGWFLNADLVVAEDPRVEALIQRVRVAGIVERAGGLDPRFGDAAATRAYLDAMEAREGDQPLTLSADLALAREVGFECAALFWQDGRETVWGGRKGAP